MVEIMMGGGALSTSTGFLLYLFEREGVFIYLWGA